MYAAQGTARPTLGDDHLDGRRSQCCHRRRQRAIILVALGAVVAGCVLAAISTGFTVLLVGRALQGVGLGLLPVAMTIARRSLPPEKARQTIATLSVTTAIGAGLGYPVTGLIAQVLDFRAAYWFGAIVVTGALVLAALAGRAPESGRGVFSGGARTGRSGSLAGR